jgi:hypothetical protein
MSFVSKIELKRHLKEIGIKVEGNFIRRSELKKIMANLDQPSNVKSIWDIGHDSLDRYTVVFDDMQMLCLSENPEHPQGLSQFTTGTEGPHLGKKIKWSDISDKLKKHIIKRSE